MEFLIYAAGPITGYSYDEAVNWREELQEKLPDNYIVLSPMRNKLYLSKETSIADRYENSLLSTSKAITRRDYFDCNRCNLIFVNLLGAKKISIGTVMEIAWAYSKRIPIVVVMEKDNMHHHAMINECADFIVEDINIAVDIVKTILYCERKD